MPKGIPLSVLSKAQIDQLALMGADFKVQALAAEIGDLCAQFPKILPVARAALTIALTQRHTKTGRTITPRLARAFDAMMRLRKVKHVSRKKKRAAKRRKPNAVLATVAKAVAKAVTEAQPMPRQRGKGRWKTGRKHTAAEKAAIGARVRARWAAMSKAERKRRGEAAAKRLAAWRARQR